MAKKKKMSGAEPQFAVEAKRAEVEEGFHRQKIRPSAPVLADLRQSLGLTQRQMALVLGVHITYASGLESGKRPFPKAGVLRQRIADLAKYVDKHGTLSDEDLELLTAPSHDQPVAKTKLVHAKLNIRVTDAVADRFRGALADSPYDYQYQLLEAMVDLYQASDLASAPAPTSPLPDRPSRYRAASSHAKGRRIAACAAWAIAGLLGGIAAMHFIPQL